MELNAADLADKISPELRDFVVNEQIKAQIRTRIRKLNGICFDKCIEKPGSKLDSKQENCIKNCIDRYLDTNAFVAQRFAQRSSKVVGSGPNEDLS